MHQTIYDRSVVQYLNGRIKFYQSILILQFLSFFAQKLLVFDCGLSHRQFFFDLIWCELNTIVFLKNSSLWHSCNPHGVFRSVSKNTVRSVFCLFLPGFVGILDILCFAPKLPSFFLPPKLPQWKQANPWEVSWVILLLTFLRKFHRFFSVSFFYHVATFLGLVVSKIQLFHLSHLDTLKFVDLPWSILTYSLLQVIILIVRWRRTLSSMQIDFNCTEDKELYLDTLMHCSDDLLRKNMKDDYKFHKGMFSFQNFSSTFYRFWEV